jgi:CubicO group peptidase (beta-lactamase class C family)
MTSPLLDRRTLMMSIAALAAPMGARGATAADYTALKAFIDSYVETKRLPGVVVGVKRANDAPVFMSSGSLAFETMAPARHDSLYRVYSMTKPIACMAAMKLIEDGKFTLDTPVGDILPQFKNTRVITDQATLASRPASKQMTVRHLVTHTSGLSYHINNDALARKYQAEGIRPGDRSETAPPGQKVSAKTLEELCDRLGPLPVNVDPGSRWQYSVAIDVVGAIVQKVSGMSFYDYLNKIMFTPMGMNDTDFTVPPSKVDRLASVYAVEGGKPVVNDDRKTSPFLNGRGIQSGGGGLISSAENYLRFTTMMMNGGVHNGRRLFKADTVKTATSNLMEPGVLQGRNGYGAGVSVILPGGETAGREPAGSYNWFGIAGTQMWVDPVNKVTVVLMLQLNPTSYPVRAEIRDAAYKDVTRLRSA